MQVFSDLVHGMTGEVVIGDVKRSWAITPGDNRVDDDIWEELAKDSRIATRVENRRLQPGHRGTRRDYEQLVTPVDRMYIGELTARAGSVLDGQEYDGQFMSLDPMAKLGKAKMSELQALHDRVEKRLAELRSIEVRTGSGG